MTKIILIAGLLVSGAGVRAEDKLRDLKDIVEDIENVEKILRSNKENLNQLSRKQHADAKGLGQRLDEMQKRFDLTQDFARLLKQLETKREQVLQLDKQVRDLRQTAEQLGGDIIERLDGWVLKGYVHERNGNLSFNTKQGMGTAQRAVNFPGNFNLSIATTQMPIGRLDVRLLDRNGGTITEIGVAGFAGRPDKYVSFASVGGRRVSELVRIRNLTADPMAVQIKRDRKRIVAFVSVYGNQVDYLADSDKPVKYIQLVARPKGQRGARFEVTDIQVSESHLNQLGKK